MGRYHINGKLIRFTLDELEKDELPLDLKKYIKEDIVDGRWIILIKNKTPCYKEHVLNRNYWLHLEKRPLAFFIKKDV